MRDNNETDGRGRSVVDWPRRSVLKLAGAGAGIAGLSGAIAAAATDDEKTDTDNGGETPDPRGNADHFISDLVDPTFGYPLAADETDDLTLEHVVDVTLEEGAGSHPGYPTEDFGDPPEETDGTPAETDETPTQQVETPNGTTGTPTTTTGPPSEADEIPVEFFFDPVGLWVKPGALVQFKDILSLHTVTAFHEKFSEPEPIPNRIPEGVPGFTSPPLVPGESWVYEFEVPGIYDYFCLPHLGLGMVGRIVVFDPDTSDIEDDTFAVPDSDGLYPNDELVLTAPELDPAYIVEHGKVAWSDITLDGEPTGTDAGTETSTGAE